MENRRRRTRIPIRLPDRPNTNGPAKNLARRVFTVGVAIALTATFTPYGDSVSAATDCSTQRQQTAQKTGSNAKASAVQNKNCAAKKGSSTAEQKWVAYCKSSGKWRPTNTVELVRGEEVAAGAKTNVGDVTQPVTAISTTKSYRWAVKCDGPLGFSEYSIVIPEGEAPVDPVNVRNQALARLTIPNPELGGSPPLDDPDRFSVVNIPTWLWITHPWQPMTESASDGGINVSVTATPTKVTWNPGDGEPPFACADAGEPWQKGKPESHMTCGHTYVRTSAGQPDNAYEITATVTWDLTWSINGTDQGQFDTYQPALTITHQVGEILSVNN